MANALQSRFLRQAGRAFGLGIVLSLVGMGCDDGACAPAACLGSVDLVFSDALQQPGHYVLDVQLSSGQSTRCTVVLPSGERSCDAAWAEVQPSDGQGAGIEGIVLFTDESPDVSITIAWNGAVIGGGSYQPAYTRWVPGGQECSEQVCHHALVEVGVVEGTSKN